MNIIIIIIIMPANKSRYLDVIMGTMPKLTIKTTAPGEQPPPRRHCRGVVLPSSCLYHPVAPEVPRRHLLRQALLTV
jgi:hypothetical protein